MKRTSLPYLSLAVLFLLAAFVSPAKPVFDSGWIDLQPGQNTMIEHGLGYRPLDVHVWTPVYLMNTNNDLWAQPIEYVDYLRVVFVSDSVITIANDSPNPVRIQVYAH